MTPTEKLKLTPKRLAFLEFARDHPAETGRDIVGSGEVIAWCAWERLIYSDGGNFRNGFRLDLAWIDQPVWLSERGERVLAGRSA